MKQYTWDFYSSNMALAFVGSIAHLEGVTFGGVTSPGLNFKVTVGVENEEVHTYVKGIVMGIHQANQFSPCEGEEE